MTTIRFWWTVEWLLIIMRPWPSFLSALPTLLLVNIDHDVFSEPCWCGLSFTLAGRDSRNTLDSEDSPPFKRIRESRDFLRRSGPLSPIQVNTEEMVEQDGDICLAPVVPGEISALKSSPSSWTNGCNDENALYNGWLNFFHWIFSQRYCGYIEIR